MNHSISPTVDFFLLLSLSVNGLCLGVRIAPWCRTSVARLRWATLAAVSVTFIAGRLSIFSDSGTTWHFIWQTLSRVSGPVAICYIIEWMRVSGVRGFTSAPHI